jgi:hypothetical protein
MQTQRVARIFESDMPRQLEAYQTIRRLLGPKGRTFSSSLVARPNLGNNNSEIRLQIGSDSPTVAEAGTSLLLSHIPAMGRGLGSHY